MVSLKLQWGRTVNPPGSVTSAKLGQLHSYERLRGVSSRPKVRQSPSEPQWKRVALENQHGHRSRRRHPLNQLGLTGVVDEVMICASSYHPDSSVDHKQRNQEYFGRDDGFPNLSSILMSR